MAGPRTPSTPADLAADAVLTAAVARCRFPASGTAVVCGVSGGADSSALLVLAVAAGCEVTAVHVDHGLRPGSEVEAEAVGLLAERFGACFRAVRVQIEAGPNLEARARTARRRALGPDALLGHTADDQAETVLLSLMRGAGLDGLAGMRPEHHPLLGLRRHDTVELCEHLGIEPFEDPSNRDPRHRRNRVRHELMPLLADIAERDLVPVLARQCELLRDEGSFLDELAERIDPTDAKALATAPAVLARRAVRRWLTGEHPPDAEAVARVLEVARGDRLACELAGGIRIERHAQRLTTLRP